jgi:hypothetical protein
MNLGDESMIAITVPRVSLLALLLLAAAAVAAQDDSAGLSARQLYFKPKPGPPAGDSAAAKSSPKQGAKTETPPKPARKPEGSGAAAVRTRPEAAAFLGLRYSILQPDKAGAMVEVDADKEFHSGEHFAMTLESNQDAFLYVVIQGSVGNWDVLFPDIGEKNGVTARRAVTIPPKCSPRELEECFSFDQDPGTERLFVVLSSEPETNLDRLIRSVQVSSGAAPAAPAGGGAMMASARLPGSQFDPIRNQLQLETRGIVREKMRRPPSSQRGENAVYVVRTSYDPRSRVATEIVLKHR